MFRYAKDQYGNRIVMRSAVDESGNRRWFPTDLSEIPTEENLPATKLSPSVVRSPAEQHKIDKNVEQALTEANRGRAAQMRGVQAANMGMLQKLPIAMGRETDKLIAGTSNLGDAIAYMFGDEKALDRTSARRREQENRDLLFREFSERNPYSTIGGAVPPYMITGTVGGPAASKLAGKAIEQTGKLGSATKGAFSETIENLTKLAQSNRHTKKLGDRMQKEWVDPMTHSRVSKAARPELHIDPYRRNFVRDTLGYGGLGAVEGGMHYDMNPIEGAIASMTGGLSGQLIKPKVSRSPVLLHESPKELVYKGEEMGVRFLPGLKTGDEFMQRQEAAMTRDKRFSVPMQQLRDSNERALTKYALKSIGLKDKDQEIRSLTPSFLKKHLDDLKSQYQKLEADSIGRYEGNELATLQQNINNLNTGSAKEKAAHREASAKFQKLINSMDNGSFKGTDYQTLRQEMKKISDSSWQDNAVTADIMGKMIKSLDKAMERGVAESGGTASATAWKDLNEKYAMTSLLIEDGLDIQGKIDFQKLQNHMMSKDPKRTLLGEGNRITKLQDATKVNHLIKHQAPDPIGSDHIHHDPQSRTVFGTLVAPMAEKMTSPINQLWFSMYRHGYPSRTGWLNMSGKDLGDISQYTRAGAQASQVHNDALKLGKDTKDKISKFLKDMGL